MSIALTYPCGRAFHIKDELAGRKIRCPECKSILAVPAAEKEVDPEDLMLEVLPADEPDEVLPADEPDETPARRSSRRAAIQAEAPVRRRSREDDDEAISTIRRRRDEDRPIKRRPKLRREDSRRGSGSFGSGGFGSINAGVAGGVLMILIAVIWFIGGLAAGYIFFYPPILLVLGIIAIVKGLAGGGS
ncbi:MAG TPA: hypothetical protein VN688_22960 [Gemmataceae bacterium]|nr:hypothetical protein [Gemmataceae bacterium]